MRLRRVRFTLWRLMVVMALLGFVLGSAVEVSRFWRRWCFRNERADLFADCAVACHGHAQRESAELAQFEAILRRLESLGPEPRSIASLIAASGDLVRTRDWFRRFGSEFYAREGKQTPLDPMGRMELGELRGGRRGDDFLISPMAAARHVEHIRVEPRRESVRLRERWTADRLLMVRAYRRTAICPWEPLPREIIEP